MLEKDSQLRVVTLLYFYMKSAEKLFVSAFFLYLKKATYVDGQVRTSSVYPKINYIIITLSFRFIHLLLFTSRYFFPVYGKETRGHHYVRHYLFFPIYSRQVDKESDLFVLDLLWPLFHYSSSPENKAVRCLLYLLFPSFFLPLSFLLSFFLYIFHLSSNYF